MAAAAARSPRASTSGLRLPAAQWDKTKTPSSTPLREFLLGYVRPAPARDARGDGAHPADRLRQRRRADARPGRGARHGARGARRARRRPPAAHAAARRRGTARRRRSPASRARRSPPPASGCWPRRCRSARWAETARLDWTLFWAAMLASLVAALLVALVPGVPVARRPAGALATRARAASHRGGRLEGGLVVAQLALAVLLAAGRGAAGAQRREPARDRPRRRADGIAVARRHDAGAAHMATSAAARCSTVLPRSRRCPACSRRRGAEAAAARRRRQLGHQHRRQARLGNATTASASSRRRTSRRWASAVDARPRLRSRRTARAASASSWINEALAKKYFPGENPIGRAADLRRAGRAPSTIVGIVEDVAEGDLTDGPVPARYMLYRAGAALRQPGVARPRARESHDAGGRSLRRRADGVQRVAPQLAVQETTTMRRIFDRAVGPARR